MPPLQRETMATANYRVLVDWNNDGDFADAYDDITADVIELSYSRGRDQNSQLVGRSIAGVLTVRLRNRDGKYNSFKATSPIYGSILPNRKVRLETDDDFPYTFPVVFAGTALWSGFLDSIEPLPRADRQHEAVLRAVGPLSILRNTIMSSIPPQTSIRTDTAIGLILDAAGWPAA